MLPPCSLTPAPLFEAYTQVQALRLACERLKLPEVADGLAALNAQAQQDVQSLLALLCPPLCTAFFPRYTYCPHLALCLCTDTCTYSIHAPATGSQSDSSYNHAL